MKIAVISDIHENFHNLVEALKIIENEECELLLCLGDYCNPGIIGMILSLNIQTYFVWGDNDGKKSKISQKITLSSNGDMADDTYRFIDIDGLKIAMTHFTDLGKIIAKSGEFDLVFCGHTHKLFEETYNDTLCVNPGELSTHKTGVASFYIYDTSYSSGDFQYIKNPVLPYSKEVIDFQNSKKLIRGK